jgi:hypothetical protein
VRKISLPALLAQKNGFLCVLFSPLRPLWNRNQFPKTASAFFLIKPPLRSAPCHGEANDDTNRTSGTSGTMTMKIRTLCATEITKGYAGAYPVILSSSIVALVAVVTLVLSSPHRLCLSSLGTPIHQERLRLS